MYKCLVVEDEKIIRKWIRYGFDYSKYNCIVIGEAVDGEEGVEKIRKLKPDIVITDITMPKKNAFEMLEETSDQLYATVIISGYTDFSNAQQAIKHGAIEYIVKPIDENQLAEALVKAINNFEAQRLLASSLSEFQKVEKMVSDKIEVTPKDLRVKLMLEYIRNNYAEKFTFEDVSESLGYGPSILYKQFKLETGMTFNEYLNTYRIRQAVTEMKLGQYKLYEISDLVGFSDYKYFSKIFKNHTGFSPKIFMESQF